MREICNEQGSSLEGLQYSGGPVHVCNSIESGRVVVPYVSYPNERKEDWSCEDCLHSFNTHAINLLLDQKVRVKGLITSLFLYVYVIMYSPISIFYSLKKVMIHQSLLFSKVLTINGYKIQNFDN